MAVVDQEAVEPLLFHHEPVADDRRPVIVAGPRLGGGSDRAVVGLGAAVERRQDVRQGTTVVQLIRGAPRRGPDEGDQLLVLKTHFLPRIEVEVGDLEGNAGPTSFRVVQRIVKAIKLR